MKKFLWKLFSPFANEVWWPNWSNFRWRKALKDHSVADEHLVKNLTEIKELVKVLYRGFKWTADDIKDLGDSITPPAQCYRDFCNGLLEDDCDGFHSLVYHCLVKSGVRCYLMSVVSDDGGHCVLVFNYKDKWYVNDYSKVHNGFATLKEAVEDYNTIYINSYCKKGSEVVYNGFIEYNHTTGKFKSVKHQLKELLK